MNIIEQTLSDALGHGKEMAGLVGKLRDKLKAGVADMQSVYDEAVAFVDSSVATAQKGLSAFKDRVAEIEGEVKDDEAEIPAASDPIPAVPVETSADATAQTASAAPVVTEAASGAVVTIDTAAGTTTHEDTSGTTTIVPHDGSEPSATDVMGGAVTVPAAALAEAVQATADAGVTVAASAAPAAQPII